MGIKKHNSYPLILSLGILSTLALVYLAGCALFGHDGGHAEKKCGETEGVTPLHCAVYYKDIEQVKKLLASGADANARTTRRVEKSGGGSFLGMGYPDYRFEIDEGVTPLHLVFTEVKGNTITISTNKQNKNYNKEIELIKLLAAAGADLNTKFPSNSDNDYVNPIELAINMGSIELVNALIAGGVDPYAIGPGIVNIIDDGRRVLPTSAHYYAISQNKYNILKELPRLGYNPDNTADVENYKNKFVSCVEYNLPTREKYAQEILEKHCKNKSFDKNECIDNYKRTKEFADALNGYKSKDEDYKKHTENRDRNTCAVSIIESYTDSAQLPLIYDYCNGTSIARNDAAQPEISSAEAIVSGNTSFADCIDNYRIWKNDYATAKDYFVKRIKKDQDDFLASPDAERIRQEVARKLLEEKRQRDNEQRAYIRANSPRANCEAYGNKHYQKNSEQWKLHMIYSCSGLRDDVIGDWP